MSTFHKNQFVWIKAGAVSAMGMVNPSEALVIVEVPDYPLLQWATAGPWLQIKDHPDVPARIFRHVDVTPMVPEKSYANVAYSGPGAAPGKYDDEGDT